MCICNLEYAGSYCESFKKVYNFSVELNQKLKLDANYTVEIES